eukprot:6179658-Pleurochrysis_carterae.AAC.2
MTQQRMRASRARCCGESEGWPQPRCPSEQKLNIFSLAKAGSIRLWTFPPPHTSLISQRGACALARCSVPMQPSDVDVCRAGCSVHCPQG